MLRDKIEKYDKLITVFLVIIAFTLGVGWWVAEEKSEPIYASKIDKLLYENKKETAPHIVLTLPNKLVFKKAENSKEILVDANEENIITKKTKNKEKFSLEKLLQNVPTVFTLQGKSPTAELKFVTANDDLLETTENNLTLPKKSAEGLLPWVAYGNFVKTEPNFKKVSIILSGLGMDFNTVSKVAEAFDSEISMSFTPYSLDINKNIIKSRETGHETYVDILLSSKDFYKEDKGPLSLSRSLPKEELLERFKKSISAKAPLGGVVFKDGYIDKTNILVAQNLFLEAKNRGLLVIDATNDGVLDIVKTEGLAHRKADIVIDKDIDKDLVKKVLEKAETIAFNKGQVMIVADPKPFIIIELYNWIKTFSPQVSYEEAKNVDIKKPFALVPVSNLVVE